MLAMRREANRFCAKIRSSLRNPEFRIALKILSSPEKSLKSTVKVSGFERVRVEELAEARC
jgi:hypothetical protein